MTQYIDKDALVAEIEKRINSTGDTNQWLCGKLEAYKEIHDFLNTLEVKEVGIDIPNIDDLFEEDGIAPASKEAKVFKECYYMALERLKEKKGERTGQ